MEISTVKKQAVGYLVNGEIFVPVSAGNRNYEEVLEWIADGNVPEEDALTDMRSAEILNRLAEIDTQRIRPLAELMLNPESQFARDKLATLEAEAAELRAELALL